MKVSPSLLAANFADLKPQLQMINESEADYLHLDVMDGVFVPNISFGFPVMKAVSKICDKPLDVHLMIVEPQKWVSQVRDLGAEIMNVHQEACVHLDRCIHTIHQAGMKAGVTLCPSTPVEMLRDVIHEVDLVLIMTVNPGFGGQEFIMHSLDRGRRRRQRPHGPASGRSRRRHPGQRLLRLQGPRPQGLHPRPPRPVKRIPAMPDAEI